MAAKSPAADAPETQTFDVVDPVSLDGQDYLIGNDIRVTANQHAELLKAGVILDPWDDSTPE